jgi:hypothetical protein
MCRGRRARILLHLHIQLEGTVLRGSRVFKANATLALHPCQTAAAHLPCTRPHDRWVLIGRPRARSRPDGHRDRAAARAFVPTRTGLITMARRRQDDADEITEADDTAGAATFGGSSLRGTRQVTPPSMPADLRSALAMPTTFGPKLFEITALHDVTPGTFCSFVTGFLRSSGSPTCGL